LGVTTANTSELDGKAVSVLVVDDSESDRVVISRQLSKITNMHVSVFEACDVGEGVDSLKKNKIDICLVDYRLGMETAIEFITAGREVRANLPFVMLSGFSREQLSDELNGTNIDHFINKEEMSPSLLEVSIKHAIGSVVKS